MVSASLSHPAPGWLSPGRRVYAIGDVHGCADRLATLHGRVAADLRHNPVAAPLLLHLGDYVDRGAGSATVVRRLAAGPVLPGVPMVCLRGNHEQMMLEAMDGDPDSIDQWLHNGAVETLRSWGVTPAEPLADWRTAVAPELPFLQGLALFHQVDGYVFVHAGLRPGVRMVAQSPEDMLWIREEFLTWPGPILPEAPGMAVVHGHTPRREPDILGRRMGLDTGAVTGGALTCAVLEGRTVRYLVA